MSNDIVPNSWERKIAGIAIFLLAFYVATGGWFLAEFLEWGEGMFQVKKILAYLSLYYAYRVWRNSIWG